MRLYVGVTGGTMVAQLSASKQKAQMSLYWSYLRSTGGSYTAPLHTPQIPGFKPLSHHRQAVQGSPGYLQQLPVPLNPIYLLG